MILLKRDFHKWLLALFVILIFSLPLFYISFGFQRTFTFNLSAVPNRYVVDFIAGLQQEEKSPTYYNWAKDRSFIEFPLKTEGGDIQCEIRGNRFLRFEAFLYVYANANRVFMKIIQGKQYENMRFTIPQEYIDGKDLHLNLRILSNTTTHPKGMRIDWIRITVPDYVSVKPTTEQLSEFLIFLLLNLLFFTLLFSKTDLKLLYSSIPIALYIIFNAIFRIETSLLIYHINRLVYFPAIIAVLLFMVVRKYKKTKGLIGNIDKTDYRILGLYFLIAQAVRIAGVYYYQYFYPDLRSYVKYMLQLEDRGFIGFTHWYSYHHFEILYGIRTPFPYSPLFHFTGKLINGVLGLPYYHTLRIVSVFYNTVFVLLVYYLLRRLFNDRRIAIFGGLFFMFSPLMFNRLFLCMYSGLFSAFITFLAMIVLLFKIDKFSSVKDRWIILVVLTLALLSYPSSFLNLVIFLGILLIALSFRLVKKGKIWSLKREPIVQRKAVIVLVIIALAASLLIYYIYFVKPILTELIPFMAKNGSTISWDESMDFGFFKYLVTRLNFYASIPGLILVLPGIFLVRKYKFKEFERKFLLSWFWTWLLIYLFAAPQLLSFILRLGKEGMFIIPLFALFAGVTLTQIWKRALYGKILALALLSGYILFSLYKWAMNIKSFMIFID
ncbi:MAG: hypothetical protein JW737_10270 [Acidobacteria bacterium]|nr:hypothetical protein [Acidobacteriota bacterium]